MDEIIGISKRLSSIDWVREINNILNTNEVKERIIDLNQQQLAVSGEDSKGNKLRTVNAIGSNAYSNYTIRIKESEGSGTGSITDHVTLFDKGSLYDSMVVAVKGLEVIHTADFKDIQDNFATDIEEVLSLNDENAMEIVNEYIIPGMYTVIENIL